jgi:hypothetical protein
VNTQATRRLVLVTAIAGALALVPAGTGGASLSVICPETAGHLCQEINPRPEPDRTQIRPLPRPTTGPNGQQMWRSGKWLMS